jgi:3',5'-cyclic AMP phosphodiesterase CpdA
VFFLSVVTAYIAPLAGAEPDLTFFGWSDQHVAVDGSAEHLVPAIEAMNRLPGKPFPKTVGGTVPEPAFVLGCGDITEWPTRAARTSYEALITKRLKFPAFDVPGNHDEGGKVPSRTILDWIEKRHGGLSYTFERGGVHLVMVFSRYDESLNNPAQPLSDEALKFVRDTLAKIPHGEPVIVATHLCFHAMTNRDALVDALGASKVLMVLGGHYHKAKVDRYRGVHFVQLPSPAPGSPSEFTVIRITRDRIVAIPYDYGSDRWAVGPRKVLDLPIGSAESAVK